MLRPLKTLRWRGSPFLDTVCAPHEAPVAGVTPPRSTVTVPTPGLNGGAAGLENSVGAQTQPRDYGRGPKRPNYYGGDFDLASRAAAVAERP